jgi:hypothetical protein
MHGPPGGYHVRRTVRLHQGRQPAGPRLGVIVEKGGDWLGRRAQSRIADARQTWKALALQDRYLGELTAGSRGQAGVVVDN